MDTCFDGRTRHYRYDDGGALIELREGELVTTFTRDAMGRMLERESQRPHGPAGAHHPLHRITLVVPISTRRSSVNQKLTRPTVEPEWSHLTKPARGRSPCSASLQGL
ncbi:hypothetical protein TW86_06550 [Halomonas sp. S2151]|uniref:hypothetical protein n=1 Tax=Halomonas sp. S2151 TaxID=579478 RepID=UPI0005F9E381|nr:hypothetical protein [Halomonas sp. S2151]KJZ16790.1 hypothetical protein TW86_06550 [Halomonas sp. S2151]MAY71263.1 hypothetical protein [Halomonas sp.]